MRAWIALAATVAAIDAAAQTVEFVIVEQQQSYTQTDNSTVQLRANPWVFRVAIDGSNLSGMAAPTMTSPGGTGATTLTYGFDVDTSWGRQSDFSSQAALNAAYFSGDYSITVLGQVVSPISVTGGTFPPPPIASNLSGGTIIGGILTWNVGQALTITLTGSGFDHTGIWVSGSGGSYYDQGLESFGVSTLSLTVPAFSLTSGQSYDVELSFSDIVGGATTTAFNGTGGMSAAQYAGVYTSHTKFTINAVPEPATYAMFAGLAVLGCSLLRRRSRRVSRGSV